MLSWLNTVFLVVILVGMAIGLLGSIVPFFPGVIIIWLAILGFGLLHGFSLGSGILFGFVTLLMLASTVIDNVLMGASARMRGTSWLALSIGMVSLLIASFFWTPLGGVLAAFVVVFLIELVRLKDWRQAVESIKGMALGCGWTGVARFGIGLVMVGLWVVWYVFM
jgi:uncharacterized protein YqgC (DUF456 family)